MPYPNIHSCRITEPEQFEEGTIRTLHTKQKGLSILSGKLKTTGKSKVQSYHYDKTDWTETRARKHCDGHDGRFEAAVSKSIETDEIFKLKKSAVNFDITNQNVKELFEDHSYLHSVYRKLTKKNESIDWTQEEVILYHSKIVDMLRAKGFTMLAKTKLDKLSYEQEATKDLESSDIPHLLESGEIPVFQAPKKKRKKVKKTGLLTVLKDSEKDTIEEKTQDVKSDIE
jgi:hypothetical protein